jgi:hypothetical protein
MKPMFVISCPIDTYSGYGARSRDLVKAIIELDKYDVKILPQRWGNTPWGFIEDHKEWGFLSPYLLQDNSLPKKPEIWAQVTVPNEFQPIGNFNIGFTAGIETTACHHSWIEGLNRMDLNIVSSEHSKQVFTTTRFDQKNTQTNEIVGDLKLEKPLEVLIEGANLETYLPKNSEFDLSMIKEDFAYLFVGHWMQGDIGEDRKNVSALVKTFLETFKNKSKTPALILKTSIGGASYMGRESILNRIDQIRNSVDSDKLPNIYLIHGELSDLEINELYNHKKVKAMVSLTKGEGYGRPLLEFSLTKKPIITTNWSGHLDFLNSEYVTLIQGELKNIHKSAVVENILIPESKWFNPNFGEVKYYLRDMFENYKSYKEKAVRQAYKSKTEFSFENMKTQLENYTKVYIPDFPTQVELQLPKLQLPKLKKVKDVEG